MRLILQRVSKAKVTKQETGEIVGQINNGLFCLLGIKRGDTQLQADELINKLIKLRIMADDNQKMNRTVADVEGKFLIVSQFTLHANTKDGNRPSFIDAEEPEKAKILYKYFVDKLRESSVEVQTGSFGDYMNIEVNLDGPVTIILEG